MSVCSISTVSDISEISAKVLEQEVENLTLELEKKLNKKQQYKELYQTEKTAKDEMAYQLSEKQAEVEKLKARIVEIPNEWDLKLRTLEVSKVKI